MRKKIVEEDKIFHNEVEDPPAISDGTRGPTPARPPTSAPLKTAPSPHAGRHASKWCLTMATFWLCLFFQPLTSESNDTDFYCVSQF